MPIVAVNVHGAFPYSFEEAIKLLGAHRDDCELEHGIDDGARFEHELELRNPGAAAVIKEHPVPVDGVYHEVDLKHMCAALRDAIPKIISKAWTPAASTNVVEAQLDDIIATMELMVAASGADDAAQ